MSGTQITMKGNALTLTGNEVSEGDNAPDFSAFDTGLNKKTLEDYKGKVLVMASVPSLDTGVCSIETNRFNDEAAKWGDKVTVLTVSMDLPFAQKRWCADNDADNVITLSDYRDASFGENYGVLIDGLRLLARCVFVVDESGVVKYKQLVSEATDEPDYDSVIEAVNGLI